MPVLGCDARGSGRALVLIHGFPFDRTLWALVIDALAETRRVIAVDLRGRGKSESWGGSGSWTMQDHAADVAATIDGLGGGEADVAGLSMGGYVTFALLRAFPEKVRSAMLISTKSGADDPAGRQAREAMAAKARHEGTLALFDALAPKVLAAGASDDARARLRAMFERTPAGTTASDALAMRDRPDSTPDLPRIRIPVCVIHGTEDALMPIAGAQAMAAAIPGARFVAIEGAGHVPSLEKPEETAAAMLAFLAGR
jgi:pimeloyl-ACP methyl ester carboxylesterase